MGSAIQRERTVLVFGVLVASVYLALSSGHLGDYPGDVGPAMTALLHGNVGGFLMARPAMGILSLLVRAPFSALADLGDQTLVYRLGAIPCVASLGLFGVWMADIARSRGAGLLVRVVIVAVILANPLVSSALHWGHPEELLTASFALGAVVAAVQDRPVLVTVLLGCALASKQWAILAVFPVLACLERRRLRVLVGSLLLAGAVTVPAVIANAHSWLHTQLNLGHGTAGTVPTPESWPFLIAPPITRQLPYGLTFTAPHLSGGFASLLHPLTIALAIAIAGFLAVRTRGRPATTTVFAATALIFLLRCTLDPGNIAYYAVPLLACLLAWDAMAGDGLPVRTLLAVAASYLVFEQLPSGSSPAVTSDVFSAITIISGLGLLAILIGIRIPGLPRGRADRRAAEHIGPAGHTPAT